MDRNIVYIKHHPAVWEVRDKNGTVLGSYTKRDEARFALKTAKLQALCDEQTKSRGVFQPHVV